MLPRLTVSFILLVLLFLFFYYYYYYYFFLGTAFPRGYKNWCKHLTLERLTFKIRWSYKSALKADTVETLHRDRQPLEKKRCFTVIARHSRDPQAQVC